MRNISKWSETLRKTLKEKIKNQDINWGKCELNENNFWDIELGLFLAENIYQNKKIIPLESVWILLANYPLAVPELANLTPIQKKMIANACHILPEFKGRFRWLQKIIDYVQAPEIIRRYNINLDNETFTTKPVTIWCDRTKIYENALTNDLEFREKKPKWAKEGTYLVKNKLNPNNPQQEVKINHKMASFAEKNLLSHNLKGKSTRKPITISWQDLINHAKKMDKKWETLGLKSKNWHKRLQDIYLSLAETEFSHPCTDFTIDGLFHLVGGVGTGKSTLMEVITSFLVTKDKQHITLVVPDVIDVLKRVDLFTKLGLKAVPILGATQQEKHLNRLHHWQETQEKGLDYSIDNPDIFRWVSSSCALNGQPQLSQPFKLGQYPCFSLNKKDDIHNYTCPLFSCCPNHQASRELITADIWLATPASLIYTGIPNPINAESLRYGELIYRRSDLLIWDEVDRAMVNLDNSFCPYEDLSLLADELKEKMIPILKGDNRQRVGDKMILDFEEGQNNLNLTINYLTHLLTRNGSQSLQKWLTKSGNFFTDKKLFNGIIDNLCDKDSESYQLLKAEIDHFLTPSQKKSKTNKNHPLEDITDKLLIRKNREIGIINLKKWLQKNKKTTAEWTENEWLEWIERLTFTLLINYLSHTLHLIISYFPTINAKINLNLENSSLFTNPPLDFLPIIPTSSQGNVIGFKYNAQNNKLTFTKYRGIGRWLVLHFHELFAGEGIIGPNVIIMSGTSWAGNSPSFHVQSPVCGILHSSHKENHIAQKSNYQFLPLMDDNDNYIRVSGKHNQDRQTCLQGIIKGLFKVIKDSTDKQRSVFEDIKSQLPEKRHKILMLTGSYQESKDVAQYINDYSLNWSRKTNYLIPDEEKEDNNSLLRSNIEEFSASDKEILIAPLQAIERGHNILNEDNEAAFGGCLFLIRPHPVPDDLYIRLHQINHWAIKHFSNSEILKSWCEKKDFNLVDAGNKFHKKAIKEWLSLINRNIIVRVANDDEKSGLIWNWIVTMNQVIGRLYRGGCHAHIYFIDDAFKDTLLLIKNELKPYFDPHSSVTKSERAIASSLYGNFYYPLAKIIQD